MKINTLRHFSYSSIHNFFRHKQNKKTFSRKMPAAERLNVATCSPSVRRRNRCLPSPTPHNTTFCQTNTNCEPCTPLIHCCHLMLSRLPRKHKSKLEQGGFWVIGSRDYFNKRVIGLSWQPDTKHQQLSSECSSRITGQSIQIVPIYCHLIKCKISIILMDCI